MLRGSRGSLVRSDTRVLGSAMLRGSRASLVRSDACVLRSGLYDTDVWPQHGVFVSSELQGSGPSVPVPAQLRAPAHWRS